jgi:hypothetical protein
MPGVRGPRSRGEAVDEIPESEMKLGVADEGELAPKRAVSGGGGEFGTLSAISASMNPYT